MSAIMPPRAVRVRLPSGVTTDSAIMKSALLLISQSILQPHLDLSRSPDDPRTGALELRRRRPSRTPRCSRHASISLPLQHSSLYCAPYELQLRSKRPQFAQLHLSRLEAIVTLSFLQPIEPRSLHERPHCASYADNFETSGAGAWLAPVGHSTSCPCIAPLRSTLSAFVRRQLRCSPKAVPRSRYTSPHPTSSFKPSWAVSSAIPFSAIRPMRAPSGGALGCGVDEESPCNCCKK